MLTQPKHLFDNPLDLIISPKNQQLVKHLMSNGMKPEKITEILISFYSYKVVLREIIDHATNPEWVETRKWQEMVSKQYEKAIRSLKKLIVDDSIPFSTRDTIIKKDIEQLQKRRDFLTFSFAKNPSLSPSPVSTQQMLNMQARALYEYMHGFYKHGRDMDIYDLITELFVNLYKDTAFNFYLKGLTCELLKKNFVDNAYKLPSEKDKELEAKIKRIIS